MTQAEASELYQHLLTNRSVDPSKPPTASLTIEESVALFAPAATTPLPASSSPPAASSAATAGQGEVAGTAKDGDKREEKKDEKSDESVTTKHQPATSTSTAATPPNETETDELPAKNAQENTGHKKSGAVAPGGEAAGLGSGGQDEEEENCDNLVKTVHKAIRLRRTSIAGSRRQTEGRA